MNYVVSSGGQPIGFTDLGFHVVFPRYRIGWLHPNARGEKVLPVVASVLPALRAYAHTRSLDESEEARRQAEKSTLFADLAAAMQHVDALDLTLHREDGSLIPTEHVAVRDMDQLLELARSGEFDSEFDEDDAENWSVPSPELEEFEVSPGVCLDDEVLRSWTPEEDEEAELPRYQVYVTLLEGHPLP